ncbi:hypothetical protein [Cystobacter fuscus]|uniref:hypothetical protein n=1 Tax=Cystobacter fuscus TaxID=43 RepID=UPI002B2A1829|nr:hypothetical protein F0U63_16525 [Cystobacter fuscus]
MTSRSDIKPNDRGWRRLSYTCRCGWVDWGHALPGSALALKKQLDAERGDEPSLRHLDVRLNGKPAFVLSYGQEMGRGPLRISTHRHWIVAKGLSDQQREEVGLGIFMSASHTFETMQGSFPFSIASGSSSFSVEDLVSNLIGFYSAFRGVSQDSMRRICGEVGVEASDQVWSEHTPQGLQTHRNRDFKPILFPCGECEKADTSFPQELSTLKAATPGFLYVAPQTRFIPGMLANAAVPLDFDSLGRMQPGFKR